MDENDKKILEHLYCIQNNLSKIPGSRAVYEQGDIKTVLKIILDSKYSGEVKAEAIKLLSIFEDKQNN